MFKKIEGIVVSEVDYKESIGTHGRYCSVF